MEVDKKTMNITNEEQTHKQELIDEINKKINKRKKIAIIIVIVFAIVIMLLLFSTIFAFININNNNIFSKIRINNIDISNLSIEEAKQVVNKKIEEKTSKNINIVAQDFEYQINLSQIEVSYNINECIEEAYGYGRSNNIFVNNYDILLSNIQGKNINLKYTYNEELLNKMIDDIELKIPNSVIQPNYCIEDNILIITKGKSGNSINKEDLKQKIINQSILENNNDIININFIQKEPEEINIEKIYKEVYTEPMNAYYIKEPFQIFPHVNGINFDLEKAKEILKEEKEEYEINLEITIPEVTTNKIGTEAFPHLLSSFTTKYDASNIARSTNLELAMEKLNGVMVNPGETFSYNKTLGKRTTQAGYKEAGGYAGGKVVQTLGGGICQISSTLYDAVVYANLEIVERHNHMFLAGYVGAGQDATVVYGALDFQFKNTRNYPIVIKTNIGNGIAKIEIYGIKEEIEYQVEISTKILSYTPYKEVYEKDSTLKKGTQRILQKGMNGCKSITYKILKFNGAEVAREVLSSDTYDPMNKIIKVGTK